MMTAFDLELVQKKGKCGSMSPWASGIATYRVALIAHSTRPSTPEVVR